MKIINLLLLFLPVLGYSQVDTLPVYKSLQWGQLTYSIETKKGVSKKSFHLLDPELRVQVFETRDTLYRCPFGNSTFAPTKAKGQINSDCVFYKVVTCRTYRLYILNEKGEREYLQTDLTRIK
jgi:hypothetical protein